MLYVKARLLSKLAFVTNPVLVILEEKYYANIYLIPNYT